MLSGISSTPLAELPFSELIKNCHLLEMAKRIGQAVIDLFVSAFNCLCCISEEVTPASIGSPLLTLILPKPIEPLAPAEPPQLGPPTAEELFNSFLELEDLEMMKGLANSAQIEAIDQAILAKKQTQSDTPVAPSPPLLIEGSFEENRKIALARIAEITSAIEAHLAALKLNPEAALQELAERETGIEPFTLRRPPMGMTLHAATKQIQAMPIRIHSQIWNRKQEKFVDAEVVNQERLDVWPTGIRAAERLIELRQKPEAALLRLAQLKATKSLFLVKEEILKFDLDGALEAYSSEHPTSSLEQWFDFVYKGVKKLPAGVDFATYKAVIHRCDFGYNHQDKIAKLYLSKLHDILLTRQKTIEPDSEEEEAFKNSVARRVDSFISVDTGCVDQINTQLERELLELLSENVPGANKTLSEQIAFQASLALTQYRSTLITATAQRLYGEDPYVGAEMADFERAVKKELMEELKLQGKIIETGAAFCKSLATKEKVDNIKKTVLQEYSPTTLLLDFCQNDNQELFRSIKRLRTTMIQHVNELCGVDEETDPLIQVLSASPNSPNHTALYAGPTTVAGTLFYLEAIGILERK